MLQRQSHFKLAKKMPELQAQFIDVADLRIGLYVYIDLGWMSHPFPLSSFKIQSADQIETIRSLGVDRIRYSPEKSDPVLVPVAEPVQKIEAVSPADLARQKHRALLEEQVASLRVCERKYSQASKCYKQLLAEARQQPHKSLEQSRLLVEGVTQQLRGLEEVSIRLLSEQVGDRASLHSINVLVLSLLLGRACGLSDDEQQELGAGALLHDIGKQDLPNRLRWSDEHFSTAERNLYQEHVGKGVALAKEMGLSPAALLCIAQHHEAANGSGFPMRLAGDRISPLASIVALTNQYDNLCNPANPAAALTPHEALSVLFAQMKARFDARTMSVFIRMMGVYPPGTVVQLTDERFAIVVSVNSSRPLKPSLIIFDPQVPKDEALVVDLEHEPALGVRRSIKPILLTRQVMSYLSPRKHICYFFERARVADAGDQGA
jgi:putative nucleotidyltransferase with HDIG domain